MHSTAIKPLLLVVHHGVTDVARVAPILAEAGIASQLVWTLEGDALPSDLDAYAGAIVFGGAMGANDEHLPGILAELRWIERGLARGFPLFGICLGAQMIARVLGARVGEHPDGLWELGYGEIRPTAAGKAWFGTEPRSFYQWHKDGFELPAGATLLAEGETFPNQAFAYGQHTLAVQFHPEVDAENFQRWHAGAPDACKRAGAHALERQLDDDQRLRGSTLQWLEGGLRRWLSAMPAKG